MRNMSSYIAAGQAHILRAAQKDDGIVKEIENKLAEQVHEIMGNVPGKERILNVVKLASKLLYYSCTTLMGYQTLGEEYTGLLLLTKKGHLPSKRAVLQMILLKCFGTVFVNYIMKVWDAHLKSKIPGTNCSPELHSNMIALHGVVKDVLSYIHVINTGIFYLDGAFYDFAKRLTGIRYILLHFWLQHEGANQGFKILGVISLLYSAVRLIHTYTKCKHQEYLTDAELHIPPRDIRSNKLRCCFCLEVRINTSVTPCGHLFCWKCIMEALQVKEECPVCREQVKPSRVVPLQNYHCVK